MDKMLDIVDVGPYGLWGGWNKILELWFNFS